MAIQTDLETFQIIPKRKKFVSSKHLKGRSGPRFGRGSRLRLLASSIIDDIASWWTVAPLVLLTIIIIIIMTVMMTHLNINHDFVHDHDHYDHLAAHVLSIPIGESGAPRLVVVSVNKYAPGVLLSDKNMIHDMSLV